MFKNILLAYDGSDCSKKALVYAMSLAEQYGASVMVDDCHATGFMGPQGRGSAHHLGVADKVDILTGSLAR